MGRAPGWHNILSLLTLTLTCQYCMVAEGIQNSGFTIKEFDTGCRTLVRVDSGTCLATRGRDVWTRGRGLADVGIRGLGEL